MPKKALKILVLNSKALKLSIDDLKAETTVPVEWTVTDLADKDQIRKLLPDFDVLVSTSLDISWKNEAKSLKAIFMPGAGWDKISPEAVPDECVVTNSYEHESAIAEYVLMSMIALDRDLINAHNTFAKNDWDYWPQRFGPFKELSNRNVLVIGAGRIGKKVLELTSAFNMNNYAIEEFDIDSNTKLKLNLKMVEKPKNMSSLISIADFVVICVPYIKSTKGMIGEKELYAMKNDSFIINPARGPIIQEKHLYYALKSNRIAGACLDTWYKYPNSSSDNPTPSEYPFNELQNVILTPHVCGSTYGTFSRRMGIVAKNINNFYNDDPLIHIIEDFQKK